MNTSQKKQEKPRTCRKCGAVLVTTAKGITEHANTIHKKPQMPEGESPESV